MAGGGDMGDFTTALSWFTTLGKVLAHPLDHMLKIKNLFQATMTISKGYHRDLP